MSPAAEPADDGLTLTVAARLGLRTHQRTIRCDFALQQFPFHGLLYDSLFVTTSEGEIAPNIVTSFESNGGQQLNWLTFSVREDITFDDGTPLDAELIKANLDRRAPRAASSRTRSSSPGQEGEIAAVTVDRPLRGHHRLGLRRTVSRMPRSSCRTTSASSSVLPNGRRRTRPPSKPRQKARVRTRYDADAIHTRRHLRAAQEGGPLERRLRMRTTPSSSTSSPMTRHGRTRSCPARPTSRCGVRPRTGEPAGVRGRARQDRRHHGLGERSRQDRGARTRHSSSSRPASPCRWPSTARPSSTRCAPAPVAERPVLP